MKKKIVYSNVHLFGKQTSEKNFKGHLQSSLVVQGTRNSIHRIKHYPVESVVGFVKTFPLDSASLIRYIALSSSLETTEPCRMTFAECFPLEIS